MSQTQDPGNPAFWSFFCGLIIALALVAIII